MTASVVIDQERSFRPAAPAICATEVRSNPCVSNSSSAARFYRYFPDKREVLFAGNELEAHLVAQVEAADPGLTPIEALLTALGTAEEIFRPCEFLLRRGRVIAANPALAERDLIKLWLAEPDATLAQLMAEAAAELREVVATPAPLGSSALLGSGRARPGS
ncbi:hypothetical protein [Streptomyces tendae]|uniref:hypothetical protein n=1 Tax=Streptomyces tendae TaxID=1932 RepID=UPI003F4D3182